ncbi:MAG: ParA family protein [Acidobacteria bacterium]|nr:ParA family protein [Acidobacteriota bacterium]
MITSLISMKGGTAKTTTAVNLAAYLALGGLRGLLVDLDPQNFSTLCLGLDVQSLKCTLADVPGREKILKEPHRKAPPSLRPHPDRQSTFAEPADRQRADRFRQLRHYGFPSFPSLVGLQSMLETVDVIKKNIHSKVELLGILPTMVDLRMKITTEIIDLLRSQFKEKVFKTVIRHNVKLLEAPSHGKTILEYDSGSMGALCYIYFGKEFLSRCRI